MYGIQAFICQTRGGGRASLQLNTRFIASCNLGCALMMQWLWYLMYCRSDSNGSAASGMTNIMNALDNENIVIPLDETERMLSLQVWFSWP